MGENRVTKNQGAAKDQLKITLALVLVTIVVGVNYIELLPEATVEGRNLVKGFLGILGTMLLGYILFIGVSMTNISLFGKRKGYWRWFADIFYDLGYAFGFIVFVFGILALLAKNIWPTLNSNSILFPILFGLSAAIVILGVKQMIQKIKNRLSSLKEELFRECLLKN